MERILSTAQMKRADRYTIDSLGVPEDVLIERAGKAVAAEIKKKFAGGRVLVCVGNGNNGADGRVVAEVLSKTHGFSVAVLNVSCGVYRLLDKKFDIIVDCIFGTGLNREVGGKYKEVIEKINSSGAFIVSCDIPSGLNGDSGVAMGVCVKADMTVAIQEYKTGHFFNDGPDFTGKIKSVDIGISLWEDSYCYRLEKSEAKAFFEQRKHKVNKGDFGKVAVVGGSKKYFGSVLLSANSLAALKTGAGYSYLFVPNSLFGVYAGVNPECIIDTLSDCNGEIVFDEDKLKTLLEFKSVAIGMGLGTSEETYKTISFLIKNYSGRLIIDADGLNSLSKYGIDVLKDKKCEIVLTPHIGEFVRLSGKTKEYINENYVDSAKEFAKEYGVILLLKSACSIITDGNTVVINTTGNSGLAKAGSGDVLSGFLAGMALRKEDLLSITAVSAYVFGKAGECAVKEQNEYTVTATDVIKCFSKAINGLFE